MKSGLIIGLCLFSQVVFADGLPVITVQPASKIVSPGGSTTLTVTATGATSFQWRFNGTDISGATSSTLQITNAQTNNIGYYMAVAKNATGWVPSLMAWLSVVSGSGGVVPFSNQTTTNWQGQIRDYYGNPLNNCWARVVAGPALDQMQPIDEEWSEEVINGYYGNSFYSDYVPTVAPGQTVYYRVDITDDYGAFITHSTVLKLIAGDDGFPPAYPTPSADGLKFPGWWVGEGLEPMLFPPNTSTNQVRIPGETFSLTNTYFAYTDYGIPTVQWRKNGNPIIGATNFPAISGGGVAGIFQSVLTITNVQAADTGIYDLVVIGNNWIVGPKTVLSIQITNGFGVLQFPRFGGTNFVCDLLGAAGRNYAIQWSTNFTDWHNFTTQYNATGTITFSNAPALGDKQFYRARLLP